eukprot:10357280-Alexandrium_andersonii.AAC.1
MGEVVELGCDVKREDVALRCVVREGGVEREELGCSAVDLPCRCVAEVVSVGITQVVQLCGRVHHASKFVPPVLRVLVHIRVIPSVAGMEGNAVSEIPHEHFAVVCFDRSELRVLIRFSDVQLCACEGRDANGHAVGARPRVQVRPNVQQHRVTPLNRDLFVHE